MSVLARLTGAKLVLSACGLAVVSTMVPGCSTPNTEQINLEYNNELERLERVVARMREECNGNQECEDAVRQFYQERFSILEDGRMAAHNNDWDAVREHQKRWDEEFRDMSPDFEGVKQIIKELPLGDNPQIDYYIYGTPRPGMAYSNRTDVICSIAGLDGPCTISSPAGISNLRLSGQVAVGGSVQASSSLRGGMLVMMSTMSDGSYIGAVLRGRLDMSFNGISFTLTVDPVQRGMVILDQFGVGKMDILFEKKLAIESWNAITPQLVRMSIPVQLLNDGTWLIDSGGLVDLDSLMPSIPHVMLDYDRDGQHVYAQDFAAFMIGWSQHETLADPNFDDVWDQADIDLFNTYWSKDIEE